MGLGPGGAGRGLNCQALGDVAGAGRGGPPNGRGQGAGRQAPRAIAAQASCARACTIAARTCAGAVPPM